MTDLPYTYTEPNGDSLRMFSDGPDLVVTVRQDGGARTVVVPREETPNLVRAVLAAGDTGHLVVSTEDAARMIRIRESIAAEDMRDRAAETAYHDLSTENATMADRIRALPLTPDGDTTEDQDAQLPDRGGDVIDDIAIALARRDDLSDEHRAFCMEVFDRFEALTSERDQVRVTRDRYRDERNTARAELADARRWGRILEAQRKDLRKKLSAETDRVAALRIAYQAAKNADLPEEDMVEPGDEVSDRVGALEQQYTDLADLVHGHGEDLTRLRRRYTAQDDG